MKSQVVLVGNLGGDPRISKTEKGSKVAWFSFAEHLNSKQASSQPITQWHDACAFGQIADFLENFCHKGARVMVSGTIVDRSYTNKKGEIRSHQQLKVNQINRY